MSLSAVNLLNIGLMVVALAIAFLLPFELFLFSYAVLGPLHYLTQISWLHDRGYFAPARFDWVPLVVLSALVTLGSPFVMREHAIEPLTRSNPDLIYLAFGIGLAIVVSRRTGPRLAVLGLVALVGYALHGTTLSAVVFAAFVPTLIHVLVFTGLFILFGALKSKSRSGYASFAVFVACAASCLLVAPAGWIHALDPHVRQDYPLGEVNCRVSDLFGLHDPAPGNSHANPFFPFAAYDEIFTTEGSWRAMRLIAFAYTYHYLNWFSKTSVIRWHDVPRNRFALVVVVWIASVALYYHDFMLGLRWLFLLSLAHVFLEFPLNHRSMHGIVTEIRGRVRAARA